MGGEAFKRKLVLIAAVTIAAKNIFILLLKSSKSLAYLVTVMILCM